MSSPGAMQEALRFCTADKDDLSPSEYATRHLQGLCGCDNLVSTQPDQYAEDKHGKQANYLYRAAHRAAERDYSTFDKPDKKYVIYDFLEGVPRTSMMLAIVEHLNELGYEIKPMSPP